MILLMYPPPELHLKKLTHIAGNRAIRLASNEREARELIPDAEIVMGNRFFLQSLPYAKKLKWMQSNSVGVDLILGKKSLLIERGIRLTCARGVYDGELSEHTLALILALYRSIPAFRDDQHTRTWRRHRLRTLHGSRCLLLGWGSLARRLAKLLTFMGAEVSGVRNIADNTIHDEITVFGKHSWKKQLEHTDILVVCLPKTPETFHIVGERELSLLPPHAIVVNIGRGGTLNDHALLRQIQENLLAGAALDVFEEEPLPVGSPIWHEPRILVSPHAGRSLEVTEFKWFGLFEENLRRYLSGEELLNLVNYEKGY